MRIYFLDWNGTLNTLKDPLDFVKSLQARGDKVVLYSGGSFMGDQSEYNQIARQCDNVKSKNASRSSLDETIAWLASESGIVAFDEVVYAEDDYMLQGLGRQLGWRVVLPEDLLGELS